MIVEQSIDQIAERIAALAQKPETAVVEEPPLLTPVEDDMLDFAEPEPAQDEHDPQTTLTEQEVIGFIKDWDAPEAGEPSDWTVEQMIDELEGIDEDRVTPSGLDFAAIVKQHAPNAVHKQFESAPVSVVGGKAEAEGPTAMPPQLQKLVESGAAFYTYYPDDEIKLGRVNHWMVKRCSVCHNFKQDESNECCGQPTIPVIAENSYGGITRAAKQALGREPIDPVKTAEQIEKEHIESLRHGWWEEFRGADELTGSGTVEYVIDGFLMKGGVTFFGGPPEGGKSLVGMSVAKALTTGDPLFGKFKVIEPSAVLWLAAEGGDNGLKIRCKKFRITPDKTKFICRTLNQGAMLRLDDQNIEKLVRQMNPVVVLETVVRFGEGNEDSAADTNALAGLIFHLISYGAKAVIAIHHARKNVKDSGASLESILRGSGDFAAMADVVIAVMRDERLYRAGAGPNEIELITCKGRDFAPVPIRLAVTEKAPEGTKPVDMWQAGFVSCIDQTGDLKWVDKGDRVRLIEKAEAATDQSFRDKLTQLIQDDPTVDTRTLAEKTNAKLWMVKATLKDMGWSKPRGGSAGKPHQWTHSESVAKAAQAAG